MTGQRSVCEDLSPNFKLTVDDFKLTVDDHDFLIAACHHSRRLAVRKPVLGQPGYSKLAPPGNDEAAGASHCERQPSKGNLRGNAAGDRQRCVSWRSAGSRHAAIAPRRGEAGIDAEVCRIVTSRSKAAVIPV